MHLIEQRLCDEYGIPHHARRDIHMKMFDGLSAFDLMNADKLEQHHINALIEEVRLMDEAYERSGLARSKAKPTNDWCNEICIPHQFELDFGDE